MVLLFALLLAPPPVSPPTTRIEKMAALLRAEDRRGYGEIAHLLADPDRGVRRRAALAAGRIGDRAAVAPLATLLRDPEAEVRQMAAFALGLVGDALAVDPLVAALRDPEGIVRARAAEALGQIGEARAAPALAQMVLAALPERAPLVTVRGDDPSSPNDPWVEARLGLVALTRLKDVRAAESVLLRGGRPRFDWWASTWAAMRLESPALRPVLAAAVASNDPVSRAFGARGLGAIKDTAAVDLLVPLVRDRDETVVVNAVRALGLLGDAKAVSAVAGLLRAPSSVLRMEGLRALAALPPDPSLRERIVGEVGAREPWVRSAALLALAHLDRAEFALVLSGLDPDPEWSVRAGMAAALAEAGDESSQRALYAMLKDEDPRVLPAVLQALRRARGADAVDTLRQHLAHADMGVRAAAAEGLVELKATGLSDELGRSYRTSIADGDVEARLSVVGALAAQKDAASTAVLREAAERDPARVVRVRAAAALRERGETARDPGPEEVRRPAVDYRTAMAPYEPRPGAPVFTPRAFLKTRHGTIEIHLNVVEAPLTVDTFLSLARRGYFNGLTFHRVVPGFVAQGGDPRGDGYGGPGFTIRCEYGQRSYGRGMVGMALAGKDTGGSQFFVSLAPAPHLDGRYTIFGWVAKGMDVADKLIPGDVIERVEVWTGP
jgi:cyclophilin family peptidyl-prolyl cis-trans isomerase/HEAT repeat protein